MTTQDFTDRELLILHRLDQQDWDEDAVDPREADDPIGTDPVGWALNYPLLPLDAAVPAPPGFELVGCHAEPRHPATYVLATDGYPAPCPHCQQWALTDAHQGCEHRGHGPWRRWRLTHWLITQLYVSGLSSSGAGRMWGSGGCDGCVVSGPRWRGGRPYVLWVSRDTWRCLRRGHLPGDQVGLGFCGKCLPCPLCDSVTAGHADNCPTLGAPS